VKRPKCPWAHQSRQPNGLNRISPGWSDGPRATPLSHTLANPNPNHLAIPVAMALPPWSPPLSDRLRRSCGSPLVAFDVARGGTHFHTRRCSFPLLCWTCACSPVPGADEFINELRRYAPPRHARAFAASFAGGAWLGTGLAAVWRRRG
jgi:hypothetical protein